MVGNNNSNGNKQEGNGEAINSTITTRGSRIIVGNSNNSHNIYGDINTHRAMTPPHHMPSFVYLGCSTTLSFLWWWCGGVD